MKKPNISLKALDPAFQKLEKLQKLHKILICVGTLILIGAAFYFLSYSGKSDEIKRLEKDLRKINKELRVAKQKASDFERVKKEKEEAQAKFNIAKKKLPESEEIPALLTNITGAGKDSDLEFTLFKPQQEKPKDFFAEIPVSIEILGDFHKVLQFFDRISRLPRIVNIKDIRMEYEEMQRMVVDTGFKGRRSRRSGRKHKVQMKVEKYDLLKTTCTATTYKFLPPKKEEVADEDKGKKKKGKKK
jgi:type IV pilus assembly protein PilO